MMPATLRAAEQPASTAGAQALSAIEQRHAGQREHHQAQREQQVGDAPAIAAEALDMLAGRRRAAARRRCTCGAALPCLAVLVSRGRTTAPMCSQKNANVPTSRPTMNLVGEPDLRIALEVVRVARAAGSSRSPAVGASLWHFWQVCSRLFGCTMDFGSVGRWTSWLPWQSKHLRGVGVAQRGDLAVVGVRVYDLAFSLWQPAQAWTVRSFGRRDSNPVYAVGVVAVAQTAALASSLAMVLPCTDPE